MQIRAFNEELQASALEELRHVLTQRHEGKFGSFWLVRNDGTRLAVLVNADEACVHYFPRVDHPGFYAIGDSGEWEIQVLFLAENYEPMEVPRAMVVRVGAANAAAEEFFLSSKMPPLFNWVEL